MLDRAQPGFLTTELDPDLLSTPFPCQTNWHVITGAPCCGKTTLVNQLAGVGFHTVPETGRDYVEREKARGRTIDEIRGDPVAFCRGMSGMQLEKECDLPAKELTFLDRGLPDCLSFFRTAGLDPNQILAQCFRHRYASVFLLERFPVQLDGVRTEDDAASAFLDEWLARDYAALGYTVLRVPVLPPEERLAFVLERLTDRGLI